MKELLLFAMVSFGTLTQCAMKIQPFTAAQISKDFMENERKHKEQWFELVAKKYAKKFKMMQDHQNEWFKFGEQNIDDIAAINSAQESEETIFNHFKRAYDIVAKQMEEWKKFCDDEHQAGIDLYNQQKSEHEKFRAYTKENDFLSLERTEKIK